MVIFHSFLYVYQRVFMVFMVQFRCWHWPIPKRTLPWSGLAVPDWSWGTPRNFPNSAVSSMERSGGATPALNNGLLVKMTPKKAKRDMVKTWWNLLKLKGHKFNHDEAWKLLICLVKSHLKSGWGLCQWEKDKPGWKHRSGWSQSAATTKVASMEWMMGKSSITTSQITAQLKIWPLYVSVFSGKMWLAGKSPRWKFWMEKSSINGELVSILLDGPEGEWFKDVWWFYQLLYKWWLSTQTVSCYQRLSHIP